MKESTTEIQAPSEHKIDHFNRYINERCETHLNFTVWYVASDGRNRWVNGTTGWDSFDSGEEHVEAVLRLMTSYVRSQWIRIEVSIPNRDQYGYLRAGYIKDTVFLLATRSQN